MNQLRIVLLLLLTACGSTEPANKSKGDREVTVTTIAVQAQSWNMPIEAVGTAKAKESTVIAAKQSDRVARVLFESGQRVQKGQILVELDSGAVLAELAEARAQLNDLTVQKQRLEGLLSKQLVSKSQYETVAANQLAAQARVRASQERVNDRIIRAPFAGVLGLRQVSAGQFVTAGFAMVNLDDLDRMWVDFPIPEFLMTKVNTGMNLTLKADAYPEKVFNAEVVGVESRVDIATRALMVRAEIENNDGQIRPGMLLHVMLQQELGDALVVPELCLQQVGNRSFVYVVKSDNTVISRDVVTGERHNGLVIILEGLKAGERIVLDGTSKLRDGQKVQDSSTEKSATP
jgi:membrane fusion protein (multidrug efflux system)